MAKIGRKSLPIVISQAAAPLSMANRYTGRISPRHTPKLMYTQHANAPSSTQRSEKIGKIRRKGRKKP